MKTNYWLLPDTHFGHCKLREYTNRPFQFESIIFENCKNINVLQRNILIHLGDFCIGNDEDWHVGFMQSTYFDKYILVRGNHDKKTDSWYMKQGWTFVCRTFEIDRFGFRIMFSHAPQLKGFFDTNIYGHSHNNGRLGREPKSGFVFENLSNEQSYVLTMLEHNYKLINLRDICEAQEAQKVIDSI